MQEFDEYGLPLVQVQPKNWGKGKQAMPMWTKLKNPRGTIFLPEILKAASLEEEFEDRVKMLRLWLGREGKNPQLFRSFMECMYHPAVKFELPACRPPFKENGAVDYGKAPTSLYTTMRRIGYFINSPKLVTNKIKRENLFIRELEGLYKEEAELLVMLICRKLDAKMYPNIDEDLFRAVMPNVLPPKNQAFQKSDTPVAQSSPPPAKKVGRPKKVV